MFVLWQLNPGFQPAGVETFSIALPPALAENNPAAMRAYLRQVHEQLASTPGVRAASLSAASSLMADDYDFHIWFAGRPKPAHLNDLPMALTYVVEPAYLQTFQIALRRGRFLSDNDNEHATHVAVIDESMAQKYFRGQDPIGQFLELDNDPARPNGRQNAQIVGVVAHVNQWGLDADTSSARPLHAQVYLSIHQMADPDVANLTEGEGVQAYVRGNMSALPSFQLIRQRLLALNHETNAYGDKSMEQVVLNSIATKRFTMSLLAAFAGLALLLAGIGIYGVLSYLVGQRTREIGIRIALGAARRDVLGMILKDGAWMTLTGIGVGVAAALGLAQLMSSVLFGVKPTDALTFLFVISILCLIAVMACYLPARRAMKVDPLAALREE
jgi:predicted permease